MNDDGEMIANLAAWKHHDGKDFYLSVEVSPNYRLDMRTEHPPKR
jgi:hypothetical protein